jgi:putative oxidoreductase
MKEYAPFVLRLSVGGIFLFAGIMKLFDPNMVSGMLGGMGFPAPAFWTWLLIAAETLCGASVLLGFKLKWATVPLMIVSIVIMAVASAQAMVAISLLASLVSLWLSGPGKWALSKE